MTLADTEQSSRLPAFLESGIYRFENFNVIFMNPVRVINRSYTRFKVSPSAYYSRFFDSKLANPDHESAFSSSSQKKRKRKKPKPQTLKDAESVADHRHQQVRPLLLKAHQCLLGATGLLSVIRDLRRNVDSESPSTSEELSFVELGRVWQAPLYEISLDFPSGCEGNDSEGAVLYSCLAQRVVPVFNNLVVNETSDDLEVEFLNRKYVMPRESCFFMLNLTMASILSWLIPHGKMQVLVRNYGIRFCQIDTSYPFLLSNSAIQMEHCSLMDDQQTEIT